MTPNHNIIRQSIKLQTKCTNVVNVGTFFYNATNVIKYTLSSDSVTNNITISTGETDLTNVIPVNISNVKPIATNSVSLALSTTMIVSSSTIYISGQSILPGTTIGKHCVVAANSVVSGVFDSYSIIAGNPARIITKL